MTAGFVTSDADALVGGAQRVIIVPPTDETKVDFFKKSVLFIVFDG